MRTGERVDSLDALVERLLSLPRERKGRLAEGAAKAYAKRRKAKGDKGA